MLKKISRIFLILLSIVFIMPVLLAVLSAFMTSSEVLYRVSFLPHSFGRPEGLTLFPETISLGQFYELLVEKPVYLTMLWNSIKYTLCIVLVTNLAAVPIAFVFSKIKFRGRGAVFFFFIVTMIIPFQVTVLSNYIMMSKTGLLGSPWSVLIPSFFAPVGIFLLRQSMISIPEEIIECTLLETSSVLKMLRYIIIPSIKSGLLAMNILIFADAWNMIEKPNIFLDELKEQPLSLALNGIMNSVPGLSFAGSVIYIIPVVLLYFLFNDEINNGLGQLL